MDDELANPRTEARPLSQSEGSEGGGGQTARERKKESREGGGVTSPGNIYSFWDATLTLQQSTERHQQVVSD